MRDGAEGVAGAVERAAQQTAGGWPLGATRARALRAIAAALGERREDVLRAASQETGLTVEELRPEEARMTGTLEMFGTLVQEGSWVEAGIDTKAGKHCGAAGAPAHALWAQRAIGPDHDVRRMLVPLRGVVAVFGASNFPLAYGVCGGDTASALGAGCPVVVKEHPAHPRTGRLIAGIARGALESSGVSADLLGYVHDDESRGFGVAQGLVTHALVGAVGFTGSRAGGIAVEKMARPPERGVPIPVFAEMGSTNPVFITRAAARQRGPEIGKLLADSIITRFGQQCTAAGLIMVDGAQEYESVAAPLRGALCATPARRMLSERVRRGYGDRLAEAIGAAGGRGPAPQGTGGGDPRLGAAYLIESDFRTVRTAGPALTDEIFGPAAVASPADLGDRAAIRELVARLGGHLTVSVFIGDPPTPEDAALVADLRDLAGRIIINGVPTGVRVGAGMVHGGPWPSSNRPDTTAVGPFAMHRWCRPVCYQNAPAALLPPELQDSNPLKIRRLVNGTLTDGSLA